MATNGNDTTPIGIVDGEAPAPPSEGAVTVALLDATLLVTLVAGDAALAEVSDMRLRQRCGDGAGDAMGVREKGPADYVTEIDMLVDGILRDALPAVLDVPLVSEEDAEARRAPAAGGDMRGAGRAVASLVDDLPGEVPGWLRGARWVVDPVDGTSNMMCGLPWAVSVALVDGDGQGVLGVVYELPARRMWFASRGGGAWSAAMGDSPVDGPDDIDVAAVTDAMAAARRLRVDAHGDGRAPALFGIPYNKSLLGMAWRLGECALEGSSDLKRIGPASVDICRVACGQARAYAELALKHWDYAAGEVVLSEAGGEHRALRFGAHVFAEPSVADAVAARWASR